MEQLTSVTGSRHNRSTAASRAKARTRAARLGTLERNAQRLADSGKATGLRIKSAAPYAAATALLVVGRLTWK